MEAYVKMYQFYRTARMRTVRLLIFSLLLFLIITEIYLKAPPKISQFLFDIFVMVEVFFHYKVARVQPSVEVSKNTVKNKKDIFNSFTLHALDAFSSTDKTSVIVKRLSGYYQVKLFLQKANITRKDLEFVDIDKALLAQSAFDTAIAFKGTYVTPIDIFVAYLFLIEPDKKILFQKQLKTAEVYNIVYWIRAELPEEERPKKLRVHFGGGGIGEDMTSGWTLETKKYTSQFTNIALRNEPHIAGREAEFKEMLEGLIKVEDNNVLLVGDIGAGKENLVRALAYHSFEGNLGGYLNYKRVLELHIGALTAGATTRSDLEVRLQNIIAEVSHSNDVVLYIPDFQNILGGSAYNLDISGALLPYLKSGIMPVIATITTGAYKTYMEKNYLKEAFTVIQLRQPDKDTAIQMVMVEASEIEKKYRVILSYRAITSAVQLAIRFFTDEALPGSAILILENVANTVSLSTDHPYFEGTKLKVVLEEDTVTKVEQTAKVAISMPKGEEIKLLLHLEDKLHERVIDQDAAVKAVAEAMRRIRSGVVMRERPISFLFLGPTGVGKTETAKALADIYYGGEKNIIRLDMSEYTDEDGMRRLLGDPPGAGDERGQLTDKIHDNPASLVLLDEFEKANPKILNLFLQVLDDGRLTDNKGITVSFRNAIIIATSNGGSEFIREALEKQGAVINKAFHQKLLEYLQTNGIFKPELLNRFDDIVTFRPLGKDQVGNVTRLLLNQLSKSLVDQDITFTYDDAVVEKIGKEGFDVEFGARPLRRYIQDTVEDIIAQKKLSHELDRGKTIQFFIDGTDSLQAKVS